MTEKLLDTLKIFFERHLIPTVSAVVASFITYYITPADNALLIKFNIIGFSVFLFCIWFLVIKLIIWFFEKIQCLSYSRKEEQRHSQREALQERETMEALWTDVDRLSQSDYRLLLKFVRNENKPYLTSGTHFGECLLNSGWVHKTISKPERKIPIKTQRSSSSKAIPLPVYETISETYQYILNDDIYKLLKYSYEHYGKISHFE